MKELGANIKFVTKEYNHKMPKIGGGCKPTNTNNFDFLKLVTPMLGYFDWANCGYDIAGDTLEFLLTNLR